jgi:hypothetical protein
VANFYESLGDTALSLLVKFGKSITLSRETGGSIDPITGAVTAGTDTSVTTTGVLLSYPDKMIDGTRILSSDRLLLLSNEQAPLPSDKPVIDGEEWSIVNPDKISPAGIDVIYKIQVRR